VCSAQVPFSTSDKQTSTHPERWESHIVISADHYVSFLKGPSLVSKYRRFVLWSDLFSFICLHLDQYLLNETFSLIKSVRTRHPVKRAWEERNVDIGVHVETVDLKPLGRNHLGGHSVMGEDNNKKISCKKLLRLYRCS